MSSSSSKPKDGPAVVFEADPFVSVLIDRDTCNNNAKTFSLVLVANWPPSDEFAPSYNRFIDAVSTCFDSDDVSKQRVYFYPFSTLHITVATFLAMNTTTPEQDQAPLQQHACCILAKAVEKQDWPTKPLQLQVGDAQIGKRAGIMLWKDHSGGIEAMRKCIEAASREYWQSHESSIRLDPVTIPSIIHSTFLRFHQVPTTHGELIQRRYRENISVRIMDGTMFDTTVTSSTVKLACERVPYMHIKHDDSDCVLAKYDLL